MLRDTMYSLLFVGLFVGVSHTVRSEEAPKIPMPSTLLKETAWQSKMHEMSFAMLALMPDIIPSRGVMSDSEKKNFLENIKHMKSLAHDLKMLSTMKTKRPDADPSLSFVASLFQENIARAEKMAEEGNTPYAEHLLRSATGYCISCHTRADGNIQYPHFPLNVSSLDVSDYQKAEMLVATRQFDRAFDSFIDVTQKESQATPPNTLVLEKSVRNALVLAVRVEREKTRVQRVIDVVLKNKAMPLFLRDEAKIWEHDLSLLDKQHVWSTLKTATAAQNFEHAKKWIAQAQREQRYPRDRSKDVLYLFATASLHRFLEKNSAPSARKAEALFLLGLCYDVLNELGAWSLQEMYYEACIREAPHSQVARACFTRYESFMYGGFSGSMGVHIPNDVQLKIRDLKKEALPVKELQHENTLM